MKFIWQEKLLIFVLTLRELVRCKKNRSNQNNKGNVDPLFPPISILNHLVMGVKTIKDEVSLAWKRN